MLKNVIAPIQAWLMGRGQCVGCGTALSKGVHAKLGQDQEKVTCRCGRIFIYDIKRQSYRRALFSEI